jgi:hypothetical protein
MAWVVKAWKPHVLAAAEREFAPAPLPIPRKRPADAPPAEPVPGEITAHTGRATLRDSPLGELFKSAS